MSVPGGSNPDSVGRASVLAVDEVALPLHVAIFLGPNDIVSDETFRLVQLTGSESVSEPFEFQLELHGNDRQVPPPPHEPPRRDLRFDQVIGRPVTFAVALPTAPEPTRTDIEVSRALFRRAIRDDVSVDGLAFWNGIVAAFAMAAPGVYHLTVRPALFRLTLANRYVIYDDLTIAQAIGAALRRHSVACNLAAAEALATARRQDWLQAGESDYEFVRRLMGKAHLYFYFRHRPRGHEVVFANRPDYPEAIPGRTLRYAFTDEQESGLAQFDVIDDYRYQQSLSITGVHTLFTRQDESWQVDGVPVIHQFAAPPPPERDGTQVFQQHKVYQYGSGKQAAQDFCERTEQASRTSASQLSGQSYCALFRAGHRFAMTEDVRGADVSPMPVRPSLNRRPFVLTRVEHEASLDGTYKNKFEATEAEGLVAAFSLADTQQGAVLAMVVQHRSGQPPGSWKYYEKSAFDPDTQRYTDAESSDQPSLTAQGVWVRFATDPDGMARWVKLAAHMTDAPEIGAQVIVSRSNDESELPEVQQIVRAEGTKTVTPSTWLSTTHVGSSYSTRYGDGISIGFGAQSSANLQRAVSIAAGAYDKKRFRDSSYSQGASYGFSTSEAQAASASQDFAATTHGPPWTAAGDLLDVRESFGSSFGRSEGQYQSSIATYKESYSETDLKKSTSYLTVIGDSYSEATHVGTVESVTTITGLRDDKLTLTGTTKSTTTITGTSDNTTTIVGLNKTSTTVAGLDQSDTTIATQVATRMTGLSTSTDMTGLANNNSLVGVAVHLSATGASTSTAVTGVANNNSITGVAVSLNVAGVNTAINVTGALLDVTVLGAGLKYANQAAIELETKTLALEIPALRIFT